MIKYHSYIILYSSTKYFNIGHNFKYSRKQIPITFLIPTYLQQKILTKSIWNTFILYFISIPELNTI